MENMFSQCLDKDFGILLVSDRCSYALGVNSFGQKLTVGGWDTRLIDDGSQYYIGLSAIKAAIAEYEMLGGKTELTELVINQLKIDTLEELKYILYYKRLTDKRILSLSKAVLSCAQNGDRISLGILNSSAEKLFNIVDIIIRRLGMYDRNYDLCITGSILDFGGLLIQPLCDKIINRHDNIEVFTYNNYNYKEL